MKAKILMWNSIIRTIILNLKQKFLHMLLKLQLIDINRLQNRMLIQKIFQKHLEIILKNFWKICQSN